MILKKHICSSILILSLMLIPFHIANADSVILMIGDGMGSNHLKCASDTKPLYIPTLPIKGTIKTHSANSDITDSAASATAYACGKKANNKALGKTPDGKPCLTIAEEAVQKGISVGLYSTDHSTGPTPSAFFAHTSNRDKKEKIEEQKKIATQTMDIAFPVKKISDAVNRRLWKLVKNKENGFFALFEEQHIDSFSHENNLKKMKDCLYDFDLAVMNASQFVYQNPDTTLVVLADHECGGLTEDCKYTKTKHTGVDILLYAYGKHAKLFEGSQDNTEIYEKIHKILFNHE